MKQFVKYRPSTFNTCQHWPLPMMHSPEIELFVQKDARPHAVYQPDVVQSTGSRRSSRTWTLDRDVALGVLEVVQENTPMDGHL